MCFGGPMLMYHEQGWPGAANEPADFDRHVSREVDVIYASDLTFPSGDTELPSQASVQSAVDTSASGGYEYVAFDIETYPHTTQANRTATKSKFETILGWAKARQPTLKFGVYAENPLRDYYRAIQTANTCCNNTDTCNVVCTGAAAKAEWQSYNDDINFSGSADFIAPSLYLIAGYEASPYTNTLDYIDQNLTEARRMCSDCEIIPFIWPLYHDSSNMAGQISNISTDNPAKVTTSDTHSIQTGDQVYLISITGSDEIENDLLTVTRVDANNFTLDGIDGSAITAYTSGGLYYAANPFGLFKAILQEVDDHTNKMILWGSNFYGSWASYANWWRAVQKYQSCRYQ